MQSPEKPLDQLDFSQQLGLIKLLYSALHERFEAYKSILDLMMEVKGIFWSGRARTRGTLAQVDMWLAQLKALRSISDDGIRASHYRELVSLDEKLTRLMKEWRDANRR